MPQTDLLTNLAQAYYNNCPGSYPATLASFLDFARGYMAANRPAVLPPDLTFNNGVTVSIFPTPTAPDINQPGTPVPPPPGMLYSFEPSHVTLASPPSVVSLSNVNLAQSPVIHAADPSPTLSADYTRGFPGTKANQPHVDRAVVPIFGLD